MNNTKKEMNIRIKTLKAFITILFNNLINTYPNNFKNSLTDTKISYFVKLESVKNSEDDINKLLEEITKYISQRQNNILIHELDLNNPKKKLYSKVIDLFDYKTVYILNGDINTFEEILKERKINFTREYDKTGYYSIVSLIEDNK